MTWPYRVNLLSAQNIVGQTLLEPDVAHDYRNHIRYADVCSLFGRESIVLSDIRGVAVVTVGSGLMMSVCDQVRQAGMLVHCVVDVGGLSIGRMSQVVEWASLVDDHQAVLLCTWHSLSSAGEFGTYLATAYPELIARRNPRVLFPCIKGLDEDDIPHELENFRSIRSAISALQSAVCISKNDA